MLLNDSIELTQLNGFLYLYQRWRNFCITRNVVVQ